MENRFIEIRFLDLNIRLRARLLDDINPAVCQMLWENLPYNSMTFHTLVSGKNIFHIVPNHRLSFKGDVVTKNRMECPIGTLFMYSPRNMLIKYGEDSEPRYFPPVAQVIDDDLELLAEVGESTWESAYRTTKPNRMIVQRAGQEGEMGECQFNLGNGQEILQPELQRLADRMQMAIRNIWKAPPDGIESIFSGERSEQVKSGSYGQYFSTLIFLEGEIRHQVGLAGIGITDVAIRACEDNSLCLSTIKQILKMSVDDSSKFIGFCGFEEYRDIVQEIITNLDSMAVDEVIYLLSLLSLYGNKLHIWTLCYFPWDIGQDYAYAA